MIIFIIPEKAFMTNYFYVVRLLLLNLKITLYVTGKREVAVVLSMYGFVRPTSPFREYRRNACMYECRLLQTPLGNSTDRINTHIDLNKWFYEYVILKIIP